MTDDDSDNQSIYFSSNVPQAAANSKELIRTRHEDWLQILQLPNSTVNTQMDNLVEEMQRDVEQRLKGFVRYSDRWDSSTVLILELAEYSSARKSIASGLAPRNVVFVAFDNELFTNVAAFIDWNGQCVILAVWPCTEKDVDNMPSTQCIPAHIMTQIETTYEEILR